MTRPDRLGDPGFFAAMLGALTEAVDTLQVAVDGATIAAGSKVHTSVVLVSPGAVTAPDRLYEDLASGRRDERTVAGLASARAEGDSHCGRPRDLTHDLDSQGGAAADLEVRSAM